MPKRKRLTITETTTAAAQYIAAQLDGTDWAAMIRDHAFCADCPVRTGPQLEDDRIEHYCMACPLRAWLLTTAELSLRAKKRKCVPLPPDQGTTPEPDTPPQSRR